jgi:hypothetical protein
MSNKTFKIKLFTMHANIFLGVLLAACSMLSGCTSKISVKNISGQRKNACASLEVAESAGRSLTAALSSSEFCVLPTNLGWAETSPQSSTSVTAKWTKSQSSLLSNQKIQFYQDQSCEVATGELIDLASTTTESVSFYATSDATYAYTVTSFDAKGNSLVSGCSTAIVIDTTAPTVTGVTSSTGDGSYKAGQTISIEVTFSEAVAVIGTPQLSLETGAADAVVDVASGSGTPTLTFTYMVLSGHMASDLDYLSTTPLALNTASIKDTAGNNASLIFAAPGLSHSLSSGKNIVIDTTGPTLAFSSVALSNPGSTLTPAIVGTSTEPATTTLYLDSACTGTAASAATANTGFMSPGIILTSNVGSNTTTTIYGKALDTAGNASTCTNLVTYTHDATAPTAGAFSASTSKTTTALTLNWSAAVDVVTTASGLQYFVCSGASAAAIDTVSECEAATSEMAYTNNTLSLSINGKSPGSTYYYNVVVKDQVGNKSLYNGTAETTNGTASAPTFSLPAGLYSSTQDVTITATDAIACYTVDLSEPACAESKLACIAGSLYSGVVSVASSLTLKAVACLPNWNDSSIASAAYSITGTVATPSFSVAAGPYSATQSVTLTTATPGATIYYTTDGSPPNTSSNQYTSAISVNSTQTINALAVKSPWADSAIASAAYTITGTVADPTSNVGSGLYTSVQSVTLSTTTPDASLYYTLDGSTPTTSSTLYASPISIAGNKTLKVLGAKSDWTSSSVMTFNYMIVIKLQRPNPAVGLSPYTQPYQLSNGNIVIAEPDATVSGVTNAGQVSLYNGNTGAHISTLTGTQTGDGVGVMVDPLPNGNFIVSSYEWDCHTDLGCAGTIADVGALTLVNGTTGLSGAVSAFNSLVGSTVGDNIGMDFVTILTNNNFVFGSSNWDCQLGLGCAGTIVNAGAATWVNGSLGAVGAISSSNSLVGSTTNDAVGRWGLVPSIVALTNGNYVVASPFWDCNIATGGCAGAVSDVGAVTWANGTTGMTGFVTTTNSLIGTTSSDMISRSSNLKQGVLALSNGHYVVPSPYWDCTIALGCSGNVANVGAITWGNGITGTTGVVSAANSLIGFTSNDLIGFSGTTKPSVTSLGNGNYVVTSAYWNCRTGAPKNCSSSVNQVGAITWVEGSGPRTGTVSISNSLVGSTLNDHLGMNTTVAVLTNNNYVIGSPTWDCSVTTGCAGAVVDAGAITWGSGTSAMSGRISSSNSMIGSHASDEVGNAGAIALTNGNYVAGSFKWNGTLGALTWGDGTTGTFGVVSAANSLVGSTVGDFVGGGYTAPLSNGNYVASNYSWSCTVAAGCAGDISRVGAVTWGSGTTGLTGPITSANSLIGSTADDQIGSNGVAALSNGNYVINSPTWDCNVSSGGCTGAAADVGAVTWGNGTTGITGVISISNSLLGSSTSDGVGSTIALPNGNYFIAAPGWDCISDRGCSGSIANAGAIAWGNGAIGLTGFLSAYNAIVGATAGDSLGSTMDYNMPVSTKFAFGSLGWSSVSYPGSGLIGIFDGASATFGALPTAD